MATMISPNQPAQIGANVDDHPSATNGYAGSDSSSKSPLANFGFFKNLTGEKKTTRDGQPPKRRGPKPDSKPALTRRQELNRQAQRTHRERKEMYIKALEQEVLRLKETFSNTSRERDAFAEENRRLKEILAAHGIPYDPNSPTGGMGRMGGSSFAGSSAGSVSGSYNPGTASTGYTSPPNVSGMSPGRGRAPSNAGLQQGLPRLNQGLDYDQIGIDFVLTLERPCMDHMQYLMVRSSDNEEDVCGHVLMATCPPESHIAEHPDEKYPHKMPDIAMPDLVKLLDLSNRLPLDGEITPIMAWAGILSHPRCEELIKQDFEAIQTDLAAKVRCYGFGAVLEDFEVRDAMSSVLAAKDNMYNNRI